MSKFVITFSSDESSSSSYEEEGYSEEEEEAKPIKVTPRPPQTNINRVQRPTGRRIATRAPAVKIEVDADDKSSIDHPSIRKYQKEHRNSTPFAESTHKKPNLDTKPQMQNDLRRARRSSSEDLVGPSILLADESMGRSESRDELPVKHEPVTHVETPRRTQNQRSPVRIDETTPISTNKLMKVESSPLFRISDNNLGLFRCHREKTLSQRDFYMYSGAEILMCAQSRGVSTKMVFISKTNEIDIKNDLFDYVLIISNRKKDYKLFSKENRNQPIFTVKTSAISEPLDYHRCFHVKFNQNGKPVDLKTALPHKRADGKYILSFKGKFVKQSIKNCILINERKQKSITVRKIQKSDLEVDNHKYFDLIYAFAFAIVSFICPY